MPAFFVPSASDERQAQEVWEATKSFAERTTGWAVKDRRIFRLEYHHSGKDWIAEVGELEPRTGEPVLVILESNTFLVCTPNRGVVRGEPILVGHEEVLTATDFEPETS